MLDALASAGKNLDALTVDDLALTDHFHGGGQSATERLARLAGVRADMRVLDVGGGLGGPARMLAARFGARVVVVDPTVSYVETGAALTARLGLHARVTHVVGDAQALSFDPGVFDVVWTQNSGMNIADKERLYAGFFRVIRPGGVLAIQEPMAGPVQPVVFPVMWARDSASNFLRTPDVMRAVIDAAGFRVRAWDDVTKDLAGATGAIPGHAVQRIIMGDALPAILDAGHRNREEGRIVMIQAVFERPR